MLASPALAAWPQAVLDDEAADGITRTDHGNGTFSYVPPAGLSYADQVGNHLTWHYIGQAIYSDSPERIQGSTEFDDGTDTPDDPTEGVGSLLGARKIDGYGRIWQITAVDTPALDLAIANYYATADFEAGIQPMPVGPVPSQSADEGVGMVDVWPNATDVRECGDSDPEDDLLLFDADNRTAFASPVTHTQSSLLHLRVNVPDGGWRCSAFKIGDRHVLTNAHCVADDDSRFIPGISLRVCSNQLSAASTCQQVRGGGGSILVSPDFSPGLSYGLGDAGDDWALITMPGGLPDPKMYLADDSIGRGEIKQLEAERVGHDKWKASTTSSTDCALITHQVYEPATPIAGTNRGTIRFKGDASNRGSGGPRFLVPPGLTAGRIIGIHAASDIGAGSAQAGRRGTVCLRFLPWGTDGA
ncbi:MAG: serine protease, partial [Myxococcota bacterium]